MSETAVAKAIWDLATIFNVGRLRVAAPLDAGVQHQSQGAARETLAHMLADKFIAEARVFAVEANELDLQFNDTPHPDTDSTLVRCFWSPQTHAIRLSDGAVDGKEYQVRDVWQPFRLPEAPTVSPFEAEDDPFSLPRTTTYRLSGWSETDRVWIFTKA